VKRRVKPGPLLLASPLPGQCSHYSAFEDNALFATTPLCARIFASLMREAGSRMGLNHWFWRSCSGDDHPTEVEAPRVEGRDTEAFIPHHRGHARHLAKIILSAMNRSAMPNTRSSVRSARPVATLAPINPPTKNPTHMSAAMRTST